MRPEIERHLDNEEIEKYSMGAIAEEESVRLDEHLLTCESCQLRVKETDDYITAMQSAGAQLRRASKPKETRLWSFPRLVPVFALMLLFLAVMGVRLMHRAPEAQAFAVSLAATRGNAIEAKAPAGRGLTLQMDLTGLAAQAPFGVEIVDRVGRRVWKGTVASRDSIASASVPQMAAGTYFVRAYAPSGALLREFGLEIEGR